MLTSLIGTQQEMSAFDEEKNSGHPSEEAKATLPTLVPCCRGLWRNHQPSTDRLETKGGPQRRSNCCAKSDRNGEKSMKSPIIKRSIMIASHRTSISLEEPFWRGLKDIAARHETSVQNVVASVHGGRHRGNLSSSLRQFVLEYYRSNCCGKAEGRKAQIMGTHE